MTKGDTLPAVATRFRVPFSLMLFLNRQYEGNYDEIYPGETLLLPCRDYHWGGPDEGWHTQ